MRTEQQMIIAKPNGGMKTVRTHSYVAIMCRKMNLPELEASKEEDLIAVRIDGMERKTDVMNMLWEELPDWNIKSVQRLYDEDFIFTGGAK